MTQLETEQWTTRDVARLLTTVEAERRYYQEIVSRAAAGLMLVSTDLAIQSANSSARSILGARCDTPNGDSLDRYFPPEALDKIRKTIETGEPENDLMVTLAGPRQRSIRVHARQIRNWDDPPRYEALLTLTTADGSVGPQLLADLDAIVWAAEMPYKRFISVCGRPQELLGYAAEMWLANPDFWSERIYADDRGWVLESYERAFQAGRPHLCEYRAVRSDGRIVWLRESARLVEDAQGTERWVGYSVDITERRLLESQFVQAQRVDAAASLGRKLAEQVDAIAGEANRLLAAAESGSPLSAGLKDLLGSLEQLRLLGGLTGAPTGPARTETVDVCALLVRVAPALKSLLGEEVGFELNLAQQPVLVRANAEELQAALPALIKRARAAMSEGGVMRVECFPAELGENPGFTGALLRPGAYGIITVEDNGESLAPETRASLFEQPSPLAGLHATVKQWGGDVAVSIRASRGSVFQIFLPRAAGTPVPAKKAVKTGPRVKAVLLVEKEAGVRGLVKKALLRHEYQVIEAESPEEASRHCREQEAGFDLMIADASMPEAAETCPELKVLYLGRADDAEGFPRDSVFLHKPFTLGELLGKVGEMTGD